MYTMVNCTPSYLAEGVTISRSPLSYMNEYKNRNNIAVVCWDSGNGIRSLTFSFLFSYALNVLGAFL